MGYVITIDTGTTNTRTFLWDDDRSLIASAKTEVGVHDTAITGSNEKLKAAVRGCLEELLKKAGIGYEEVSRVMASGMITSNVGLVEVPHVFAPAGRQELAEHAVSYLLPDVCPLPILFIPGVKNAQKSVTMENFESMDIMRGEEVETIAILNAYPKGKEYMLVLPGSHTKFVRVDAQGRIASCLTTITGELLDCITNHTVIADAVAHQFVSEENYDREMVLQGYKTCMKTGMGRAVFSARILNMFTEKDKQRIANYILGVALASDIQSIHHSSALRANPSMTVIVSGKNPLRKAIVDILKTDDFFPNVQEYIPDPSRPLSAEGTYLIANCINRENGSF